MVQAVLRSGPATETVAAPVRAMLGFLQKLTLRPAELGPADLAPVRAAGVSAEALDDAIHVAVLFNIIDRIADALGFAPQSPESLRQSVHNLLSRGYVFG